MGVYLSAPICDKESFDEQCTGFTYGASSMQGWRVTQEDAHNCIPEFGEQDTSFFAVYDGHGGAEVAKYCQLNFPDFLKSMMKSSKEEELTELIQSAFLQFDATLAEEEVVKKLKELAGKDDDNEDEEDPDVPVGRTEADMLKAEADIPLEELLAKYKSDKNAENSENLIEGESSGISKLEPASSSSSSSEAAASSSQSVNGPNVKKGESNENINKNGTVAGSSQSQGSSVSKVEADCSSSGQASTTSGEGSAMGERASKTKAASDMAKKNNAECCDESSDDDDDDSEEDEDAWEDASDDDDEDDDEEEEEDVDNDIPMMDMTNEEPGSDSGCTACVVLKQMNELYVANAGDSRCVLSRDGVAVELSFDHKPEDDPERERIEKAGGKVTADGRVNGGLNLSRAFGDHVYKRNNELPSKEQMISALPDVKTIELNNNDQFFVIACDGIWNFMSSQEVVDYVKERLSDPEKRKKPSLICEELFDHCLAPNIFGDGTGCDNMTCILVVLDSAKFDSDQANHKEENTETVDGKCEVNSEKEENAIQDDGKGTRKRTLDNGDVEQSKKVKVEEETG